MYVRRHCAMFQSHYPNSTLIKFILAAVNYETLSKTAQRVGAKRSRDTVADEVCSKSIANVLTGWYRMGLTDTFLTLVDTNFFLLMKNNLEHPLIEQLTMVIYEFRNIITKGEYMLFKEDSDSLELLLSTDMERFLNNAAQTITSFVLSEDLNKP